MSITSPADTGTNTGRGWLPGAITAVLLLGAGMLVAITGRQYWWLHSNGELLSLLSQAACLAAVCIGLLSAVRFMGLQTNYDRLTRILATLYFMYLALKIGGRYIHLCTAGSRLIEGFALFGPAFLIGIIIFTVNRRGIAYTIATILLIILWLLARPYLDWVHGV